MSCFRFYHWLLPPKKHFSYPCLRRNHTSALLWNESSYQPCLTGSSPPLSTRGTELSLVSATVVEAVDRSRDRQTYVPSKIQEGRAFLFSKSPLSPSCIATPRCCLRRGCLTVSSWSQLKLSQSTDWKHLSLVHTHMFANPRTGHTHRFMQILYTELKISGLHTEIIC